MSALLAPLPVVIPLLGAALLLLVGKHLPGRVPDAVATLIALAVIGVDIELMQDAAHGPVTYWFGAWAPRGAIAPGIGFVIGQADALFAAFIAVLFAASFVFAWGYFEDIRAFFHVLMLLFFAAMQGFCCTHDLFNLFVWFEVMSVAAFALTAYRLEASPLEGALNFTITNSLASFLMLGGIALLYLRAGTLDFGALARALAHDPHDAVAVGAFCLLGTALLIKAAAAPFHFWLADAHAVAPSPVSVIFSGAMVPLGLFGLVKLYWEVFLPIAAVRALVPSLFLALGMTSAVVGGLACMRQRHLKRLLAFSTISHMGVALIAFSLARPAALGGCLLYLLGHGLIKGALFMLAGILLARLASVDEIDLRGRGRQLMPAGIAMLLAAVLLGGAPLGLLDQGARVIDAGAAVRGTWAVSAIILSAAFTGAAVLRATARIFLGWGALPGDEEHAPSESESERANRPLWLMLLPVGALLALALLGGERRSEQVLRIAAQFIAWDGPATFAPHVSPAGLVERAAPHPFLPWLTIGLAVLIAAHELARQHLPGAWRRLTRRTLTAPLALVIDRVHNGVIGEYVMWILVGITLLSMSAATALR